MAEHPPKQPPTAPGPLTMTRALDLEIARQADVIEAMNAVCARLGASLARWIGADGWQALLRRAVAETARPDGGRLSFDELGDLRWVDPHHNDQARDTCVRVLEAVVVLLTRFIGVDMASRIVEDGLVRGCSSI